MIFEISKENRKVKEFIVRKERFYYNISLHFHFLSENFTDFGDFMDLLDFRKVSEFQE